MPDPVLPLTVEGRLDRRRTRAAEGVGRSLQELADRGAGLQPALVEEGPATEFFEDTTSLLLDTEISGSKNTWRSIHDVADSNLSEFEKTFSKHVKDFSDDLSPAIDEALGKKNIQEAINLSTQSWNAASNKLKGAMLLKLRKTLVDSANEVAKDILTITPKEPYEINFRYTNPRATEWARKQSSHLVTKINEDQRTTIRNIITKGFDEQLTGKQVAMRLRGPLSEIGLQSRQQTALDNFRKKLLAKKGADKTVVDKRVASYKKKLIRKRAESIARTELARSANMGQQLLWEESIANGTLDPNKFVKLWMVTPDDRLCPICETYVGYSVEVLGTFEAPSGAQLPTPPLHPMCRCSLALIRKPENYEAPVAPHRRPDAQQQKKSFKAEKDEDKKKGRRRLLTEQQSMAVDPKMGVETKFLHAKLDDHGNLAKDEDGNIVWNKDRQKLHRQIVDDVLKDGGEYAEDDPKFLAKLKRDPSLKKGTKKYDEARKRPAPTKVENPQVVLLGGGPASGKTVAANRAYDGFSDRGNAAKVDPDEIRAMLPEYKAAMKAGSPHGASMTHVEASHIAALARAEAQKRRLNLIKDGTGGGLLEDLKDDVKTFRRRSKNDLKIVGNYVSIKTDEAVARMAHRAGATGRHVPEVILRNTHREVSESVIEALPKHGLSKAAQRLIEDSPFDEFKLWDNAEGFKGEPHLIYEWSRKKVDGKWIVTEGIVDPDELDALKVSRRERYQQFLDKAEEGKWGKSTVYQTAKEKRAAGRGHLRKHSARDK
tara:strand:- start:9001 stop:11313 length:2313 start_codon:yes stop_codon:yes gene_type:complete